MNFKEFIKENEEIVISKEIDSYLKELGFIFNLNEFTGEYYKLIKHRRCTFKLSITSHRQIYLSEIGNSSRMINVLSVFEDAVRNRAMLENESIDKIFIDRELLNRDSFINTLVYIMENFAKESKSKWINEFEDKLHEVTGMKIKNKYK